MEPLKYENGKPLKYKMGLATRKHHDVTTTRRGCGRRHHSVGEWVSVSLSTLYLYFVSPLYLFFSPLTSLFFFLFSFFLFCFLRFLLSPFGFGLLRVRAKFFFFKIYMGYGLLGWSDDGLGFMIFGRGARAKNSGAQGLFFF